MKRGYIFTLSLLASLPACCLKKCKPTKETASQHLDAASAVSIPFVQDLEHPGKDEDARVLSFFDEDLEEFTALDDDYSISAAYDVKNEDQSDMELFSWVDAQIEDEFKAVYFDFNSHGVRADQVEIVKNTIDQLKLVLDESDTNVTVVIDGHADQEGSPAYNLPLSEKRAKAVADILVSQGIAPEKIKIVGRGQEVPAVINGKVVDGSREDRWPNRRAQVHVIYT